MYQFVLNVRDYYHSVIYNVLVYHHIVEVEASRVYRRSLDPDGQPIWESIEKEKEPAIQWEDYFLRMTVMFTAADGCRYVWGSHAFTQTSPIHEIMGVLDEAARRAGVSLSDDLKPKVL